jgi:hypothetical protein
MQPSLYEPYSLSITPSKFRGDDADATLGYRLGQFLGVRGLLASICDSIK